MFVSELVDAAEYAREVFWIDCVSWKLRYLRGHVVAYVDRPDQLRQVLEVVTPAITAHSTTCAAEPAPFDQGLSFFSLNSGLPERIDRLSLAAGERLRRVSPRLTCLAEVRRPYLQLQAEPD